MPVTITVVYKMNLTEYFMLSWPQLKRVEDTTANDQKSQFLPKDIGVDNYVLIVDYNISIVPYKKALITKSHLVCQRN